MDEQAPSSISEADTVISSTAYLWRWERKAMPFDGMVRENESPGRLRWLRDTPYRPGGGPEH